MRNSWSNDVDCFTGCHQFFRRRKVSDPKFGRNFFSDTGVMIVEANKLSSRDFLKQTNMNFAKVTSAYDANFQHCAKVIKGTYLSISCEVLVSVLITTLPHKINEQR